MAEKKKTTTDEKPTTKATTRKSSAKEASSEKKSTTTKKSSPAKALGTKKASTKATKAPSKAEKPAQKKKTTKKSSTKDKDTQAQKDQELAQEETLSEESEAIVEHEDGSTSAEELKPQEEVVVRDLAILLEDLSGPSRRARQDASHELALIAQRNPNELREHTEELIDALYRPEAQTRWEVLSALTELSASIPDAVAGAYDGAEASLFDEGSATVRLAAFLFLCRMGASSPKRSDDIWPLLDEAIQCYHGDAEYRDMLTGLLELSRGDISAQTKKALVDRVSFDAENGVSYIKAFSAQIVQESKRRKRK